MILNNGHLANHSPSGSFDFKSLFTEKILQKIKDVCSAKTDINELIRATFSFSI